MTPLLPSPASGVNQPQRLTSRKQMTRSINHEPTAEKMAQQVETAQFLYASPSESLTDNELHTGKLHRNKQVAKTGDRQSLGSRQKSFHFHQQQQQQPLEEHRQPLSSSEWNDNFLYTPSAQKKESSSSSNFLNPLDLRPRPHPAQTRRVQQSNKASQANSQPSAGHLTSEEMEQERETANFLYPGGSAASTDTQFANLNELMRQRSLDAPFQAKNKDGTANLEIEVEQQQLPLTCNPRGKISPTMQSLFSCLLPTLDELDEEEKEEASSIRSES